MQRLLLTNGIKLPKYGADGDFGGETEKGVMEYQRKVGLDDDGIVGSKTMGKLLGV
jgi:peptidoglycan hydrolase-like protein with peptidoglycan-binding domain